MQTTLLGLAIAFIIALVAALIGPYFIDWNQFRPQFEAEATRIFIGAENRLFALSGSSVIAAPYRDREGKVVGVLGVIGPTRLNYARVVPMVDFTAATLARLLA